MLLMDLQVKYIFDFDFVGSLIKKNKKVVTCLSKYTQYVFKRILETLEFYFNKLNKNVSVYDLHIGNVCFC